MSEANQGPGQSPSQSPGARTPWPLIVLLGSLTAIAPVAIDTYLPSLPTIGEDLGASAAQTQATVSAFLAGMAIGQVFYGPASDRFGRRAPILLGIGIFILASAGCALAPSAEALIGLRFLQALGGCAGAVVARAAVRDRFGYVETARILSLLLLVMGLAPVLAPLLGGAVLAVAGWRAIFWVMTGFGLAIGVAAFFWLGESRSEETRLQARAESPFGAYASLLRQPRLGGYALTAAFNGVVLFTYISASPGLLIGTYGISPGQFGWIFGLNAAGLIGASQVNRVILRRITPDRVLLRASTVAAGVTLLLALAAVTGLGERWTILPLLFLLLSSYAFMQGNAMAGALNVDPRRAGSVSALMGAFSFGAGAGASALTGMLHDGTARPMALVMLVAIVGSAVALRTLALPKAERAQA